MNLNKLTAVVAVALSTTAFATPIDLIENGSFEIPRIDYWATYPDIPGWRASEGGLEIQPNGTVKGVTAYDGRQYAELDTYINSAMWQNVATLADHLYTLTFAYMPRPDNPYANSNNISAYWNGVKIDSESGTQQDSWTTVTVSNLASRSGGGSQLLFMATGRSDSYGGFIDGVKLYDSTPSVSTVSEPSSYAMMIIGLFAFATVRKYSLAPAKEKK